MTTFAVRMKKWLSYIKEFLQYVSIILLSFLSVLWLTLLGRRHK